MKIRINTNSLKNAVGTVFLLATAFFVCSTFISMRSVFADPITPTVTVVNTSGRVSPRMDATKNKAIVSRVATKNNMATKNAGQKTTVSRGGGNRTVSTRSITPKRINAASNRNVVSRNKSTNTSSRSDRSVRARTGVKSTRVSSSGSVMPGTRASSTSATGTSYTYLASKLYSNTYSSIVDSTTGLISADAYNSCLESYYTCMDEICTARSDAKGRCTCAGRARSFLQAEEQLESANEELIKLSGQLSLLIATKGKGDQLSAAFSLTEAEQVMNCVSYKETTEKYGRDSEEAVNWCTTHNIFDSNGGTVSSCNQPSYCKNNGNNFGFDISNIDGSSSDILAQLKAWADAKDLAKQYTSDDEDALVYKVANLTSLVSNTVVSGGTSSELDSLANKWGYDLFQYAHNNVCGRVLDACFNGIFEACGTPPTILDADGTTTHTKCANSATSNCPYNYNSYISVKQENGQSTGEVILSERGSSNATIASSASCFGYINSTSSSATAVRTLTSSTSSADPYSTLRGPVADARRSIIQKYLLDANAACDAYGAALTKTAQNINYQKIAAEQSLRQKRLQFKQENDSTMYANAQTAVSNFTDCIDEIWDCYQEYESSENWTTARIKSYCSQVSQVPHCYETMICSPLQSPLIAVVDKADDAQCDYTDSYETNTCRNVVTISEILYGTGYKEGDLEDVTALVFDQTYNSKKIREECLQATLNCTETEVAAGGTGCIRNWTKQSTYTIKYMYQNGTEIGNIYPATYTTNDVYSDSYGFKPTVPVDPDGTNRQFKGWSQNAGCSGYVDSEDPLYIRLPHKTMGTQIFYACFQ